MPECGAWLARLRFQPGSVLLHVSSIASQDIISLSQANDNCLLGCIISPKLNLMAFWGKIEQLIPRFRAWKR